eukprot:TRINITY_DN24067_c0_g1_i1.p3 TRINITY_DN24067_c0_g1~~TRINITY_DN24067_c0_g1_i1.p3  ORF type:complete len:110 (-),score=39.12 TRINITY_DN24067_c0_g1_i1:1-330(-)
MKNRNFVYAEIGRKQEEFKSQQDYDDYLEMIEDMIEKLMESNNVVEVLNSIDKLKKNMLGQQKNIISADKASLSENQFDKKPLPKPISCLLYTSPSPRDRQKSRMPSSA